MNIRGVSKHRASVAHGWWLVGVHRCPERLICRTVPNFFHSLFVQIADFGFGYAADLDVPISQNDGIGPRYFAEPMT